MSRVFCEKRERAVAGVQTAGQSSFTTKSSFTTEDTEEHRVPPKAQQLWHSRA
jgi:hypothetical protein